MEVLKFASIGIGLFCCLFIGGFLWTVGSEVARSWMNWRR